MNGNKNEGASKKRIYRTIKVTPTTSAIRAALAVSATMLALSGSGAAFAGSCIVSDLQEVTCNGAFTDDVTNDPGVLGGIPDLTLIVGTDGTSTVNPAVVGTNGITSFWGGDATVVNYAEINTEDALSIEMDTNDGIATVDNHGSLYVYAGTTNVDSIDVEGSDGAYVTNSGDITVVAATGNSYNTTGIDASSYSDDSTTLVTNVEGGSIVVGTYDGIAVGVLGYGAYSTVDNAGSISTSSIATGTARGIELSGKYTANVVNSGAIEAFALDGNSVGIMTQATKYADVHNTGTIDVGGNGPAIGASVISFIGDASLYNSGTITVTSFDSAATGAIVNGKYADITNTGVIDVAGYSEAGGLLVNTLYSASISNSGTLNVSSYGFSADATGIEVIVEDGSVSINNSGAINVTSFGDGDGPAVETLIPFESGADAVGIRGVSYSEGGGEENPTLLAGPFDVNEVNSGPITVTAAGNVTGMYAGAFGAGSVYMNNISPGAITLNAGGYAVGMWGETDYGSIEILNSGDITLDANTGVVNGIYAYNSGTAGDGGTITVTNSGNIDAYSYDNYAVGIYATNYAVDGDTTINNSGTVYAGSHWDYAIGVVGFTWNDYADVSITTTAGSISAYSYDSYATGIEALVYGYESTLTVNNGGDISAISHYSDATGIAGTTRYDATTLDIQNSGSISVDAYNDAKGIAAYGNGLGDTTVGNAGTIDAISSDDDAMGIYAFSSLANVNVDNAGTITVSAYDYAWGIYANSGTDGDGDVNVTNSGSIDVTAAYGDAYGIYATTEEYGSIHVDNSGTVNATGTEDYDVFGIYTWTDGDSANVVVNSGSVSATGADWVNGIYAQSGDSADFAAISITNSGTVNATSTGGWAQGLYEWSRSYGADLYIGNSGTVTVSAFQNATGIWALPTTFGYIEVNNSGSIDVYSEGDDSGRAFGVYAFTDDEYDGSTILVDNSGTITALANNNAYGVYTMAYYGAGTGLGTTTDVFNSGEINATSANFNAYGIASFAGEASYVTVDNSGTINADGYYYATGILADIISADGVVTVNNNGEINANAIGGAATMAFGINAYSYYGVYVTTGEDSVINAYATGDDANAYGILEVSPGYAYFSNHGEINSTIDAATGYAFGARVSSEHQVYAYNYGHITATAYGADTQSVGIVVESVGYSAGIRNEGEIYAYADNIATGVWLDTQTIGYVYNYGTIAAYGGVHGIAVYSSGASTDFINNYGTIVGSIWTNANNDVLYNGEDGAWYAYETSYFGDGDDTITNYGLISLNDATIDLGYHDVTGNYFNNYGVVAVSGTDNVINMGWGPAGPLIPSLNPNPFYNYGTIDFQDGDPDDILTIIGDFAGDGDINVDVSGLDGTSDLLYIDGSVVSGTVNSINVDLADLPESLETLIPIVYVSGVSVDGNFVLGDVNWDEDNSFVTLDFGIISDIDASNATDDVFSLGIEVTGLSDPGTLAASVGPSVLSLVNTSVGTWRQRMGVIDNFNKGAIALWARVFSSKGSIQPSHTGDFVGGNFDFEQKNSGVEAGIDFSVTDEFAIGLLLAKSQADVDLDNGGNGGTDLDADTWGIYGTWISPNGFYLDASYRWTDFDVDLSSVAGHMESSGDAETFNIEAGYAWTLSGGLKIEPQLQYTKTTLDNVDVLHTINGMTFSYDDADSSRGRLGVAIRKGFGEADTGWLWTPYAALSVVREFDGEALYSVNNVFHGESDVEGTSVLLELGFTARHQNWSVYGGLNFEDGGAMEGFFGGQLGVRYTFGGPAPAPVVVVPPPAKTCADLDDDGDGVNNCDDKCLGSAAGEAVGPDGCPVPPEPVVEPKPFRG